MRNLPQEIKIRLTPQSWKNWIESYGYYHVHGVMQELPYDGSRESVKLACKRLADLENFDIYHFPQFSAYVGIGKVIDYKSSIACVVAEERSNIPVSKLLSYIRSEGFCSTRYLNMFIVNLNELQEQR